VADLICIFLVSRHLVLFSSLPKLCYSFCGQRYVYTPLFWNISSRLTSILSYPFVWGFSYTNNLCKDITRFPIGSTAVGGQLPSNCIVTFNVVLIPCDWLNIKICRKMILVTICHFVIFLHYISEYEGHVREEFSYKVIHLWRNVVKDVTAFVISALLCN